MTWIKIEEIKPITSEATALRPLGLCAGEFIVPDDFDEPLPDDVLCEFESKCSAVFRPIRDARQ